MMNEQYYYSYSAKGFFWLGENDLKGNDIPYDLKPLSEVEHAALFKGQSQGLFINFTPDGPELIEQPEYPPEELIAQAENKKEKLLSEAEFVIAPLARAVKLKIATQDEIKRLEAWEIYSVMVNRVDTSNPEWPEPPEDVA